MYKVSGTRTRYPVKSPGIRNQVLPDSGVRKAVLFYGLLGGAVIALLQTIEYRYLVVKHSIEIYGVISVCSRSSRCSRLGLLSCW